MKPYTSSLFLLIFCLNSCHSYPSPEEELIQEILFSITSETKMKPKSTLYFDNTQYATKQIQNHLKKYTELPEDKSKYCDVRIFLEVDISESGKIGEYRILTTTLPTLNEKVLNAMKTLKSVNLIGDKYEGSAKIYVLIKFL